MIQVTITKNKKEQYIRFDCLGHAGYAKKGEDIVCAGVSALVINTINAISTYTDEAFLTDTDADSGKISVTFRKPPEHDAKLLMDAMVLGLQGILEQYGAKYVTLNFKEV